MEKIHLWPEGIADGGDSVSVSATVERPDRSRWLLRYRLPAECRPAITESCDPFVLGVIFSAMKAPADLAVHGAASPSLLRNLVEFQDAWASWRPGAYRRIEISADVEREGERVKTDEAIMAFSGGVDSAFTAWRHRPGSAGIRRPNIVAGAMVNGFDIPLADPGAFARAAEKSRRMLSSLGMGLVRMECNYRDQPNDWEDEHGAAIASCLMLLGGRYSAGIIASSYPYSSLILPYGSNPVTDWMMSSESFRIVHDGAAVHKIEKMREICRWPEALKELRVCWQGALKDRNCCRCQKCVWTMLVFRRIGQGVPECFERDITDWEIVRLRYPDRGALDSMRRLIARAKAESFSASWLRALKLSVLLNRLRLRVKSIAPSSKLGRRIYRFFLPPP